MQPILATASLAILSVIWWPTPYAFAQDAKMARGTIVDLANGSLTVTVRDQQLKFAVDSRTVVEARGGSTKTRAAMAVGRPGPGLADVLRVGQGVAVTYHDVNGVLQASHIRAVLAASPARPQPSDPQARTSTGSVQSIGPNSITITANGSGATFTQTFTVDEHTKVLARGAGTAAAANGGRAPFNELVASGDRVVVSYHQAGGALQAVDVRVIAKAMH